MSGLGPPKGLCLCPLVPGRTSLRPPRGRPCALTLSLLFPSPVLLAFDMDSADPGFCSAILHLPFGLRGWSGDGYMTQTRPIKVLHWDFPNGFQQGKSLYLSDYKVIKYVRRAAGGSTRQDMVREMVQEKDADKQREQRARAQPSDAGPSVLAMSNYRPDPVPWVSTTPALAPESLN